MKKFRNNKSGSTLIVMICVCSVLMLAGLAFTWMTGNAAFVSRKLEKGVRALSVAEAGVADMLAKLETDYYTWAENCATGTVGDATFVVSTEFDGSTGHIIITSTGIVGNDRRTTVLEILGELLEIWDNLVIDGAIVCGGDANLETGALEINGDVHANGNINHSTGNPTVDGHLQACGTIADSLNVTPGHEINPGAAPISIPDYTDTFPDWKTLAQADGCYFEGDQTFPHGALAPNNGVIYVTGDVEFGNNSWYVGTLVAEGTITINNRLTQTSFNTNWPSMLSLENINLHNRNSYYGIIWAAQNIDSHNNRYVDGSLVALGDVSCANRAELNPLPWPPDWDPDDTNDEPPEVIVGGWLE